MAVTINASLSAGLVQTADTSGDLNLQSGGTTRLAVTSTGVAVTGNLTASALTSGRVVYAGTGGLLSDSANLTYSSLILNNIGPIKTSSNRVPPKMEVKRN